MRRFLTTLALGGIVLAPTLTIAKNPFDFSDWTQEPATSSSTTEAASAKDASAQSPTTSPGSLPANTTPRVKSYAAELFGTPTTTNAAPAGAPLPSEQTNWNTEGKTPRASAASSDPFSYAPPADAPAAGRRFTRDDLKSQPSDDSLKRFDEFLKSQKVLHAEFQDSGDAVPGEKIQQVAEETSDKPARWQLQSKGTPHRSLGLVEEESVEEDVSSAASPGNDASNRFWFVEEQATTGNSSTNSRLTEAIPTTPVSREAKVDHPTIQPASAQSNPFDNRDGTIESAAAERASEPKPAAEERQARVSVTRAATPRPAETSASNVKSSSAITAATSRQSSITAVWSPKGPLNLGQECPCDLVITNTRKVPADEVTVETRLPGTLRLVNSEPAPVEAEGALIWSLNSLQPGEERRIQLVVVPEDTGALALSAAVRSTDANVQSLTVVQPQLDVSVTGPTQVSVGEPASQTVVVQNPGSGVATNVKLEARLPEGLEHVRGSRLVMDIGSLNPGESRRVRLALAAVVGGPQVLQVEARADSGLVQTASAEVVVAAPQLKASIDGPGLRYLGREAMYVLRVQNEGDAPTDAVQMVHRIPEGFDFIRSDRGAQYDSATRNLTWFVGRLTADQPQDLQVTLIAKKAGEFVHAVRAASEHGSYSDARMTTRVEGTPSLVMEVEDLDDPVEVGVETAYEVIITNEGTASSHDVALACELPAGVVLLRAEGPAQYQSHQSAVEFQPVGEVGAGESLTYRIYVKGAEKGDKRLRCRLSSAHLSQPLFTEEFTKFYGE